MLFKETIDQQSVELMYAAIEVALIKSCGVGETDMIHWVRMNE